MTKSKTLSEKTWKIYHNSLVKHPVDFVGMYLATYPLLTTLISGTVLALPTAFSTTKKVFKKLNEIEEEVEQEPIIDHPGIIFGASMGGANFAYFTARYDNHLFEFVYEHPLTLLIPLATNLTSLGYEIYKHRKNKGLEEKVE